MLKRRALRDSRTCSGDVISDAQVMAEQQQATILITPWLSDGEFTEYSFHSKMLEYMSTGRPVVSCKLPGIPLHCRAHYYLIENETAAGIAATLRQVLALPAQAVATFGTQALEFVVRTISAAVQGRRLIELIEAL